MADAPLTIGHPPLLPTESPTLLALGWGVAATWWVGLPLGVILSVAARHGRRPKLSAAELRRPIVVLLLVMGICAIIGGVVAGGADADPRAAIATTPMTNAENETN